jgi:hypothetical protein
MSFKALWPAFLPVLMFGIVVALGAANSPQDEKNAHRMSQDELAKMKAAATPGEPHRMLAKLDGIWDQDFQMPGHSSTGSVTYKTILGGRFVTGETKATMKTGVSDGQSMEPWEGFQILGYDNVSKQHFTTWCDTMGTGLWYANGTADATGKIITYEAPMKDATTPNGRPFKVVVNCESDDKHTIELWDSRDGKPLSKMGTITETRRK